MPPLLLHSVGCIDLSALSPNPFSQSHWTRHTSLEQLVGVTSVTWEHTRHTVAVLWLRGLFCFSKMVSWWTGTRIAGESLLSPNFGHQSCWGPCWGLNHADRQCWIWQQSLSFKKIEIFQEHYMLDTYFFGQMLKAMRCQWRHNCFPFRSFLMVW